MRISFSPYMSDEQLALSLAGEVLTINGDTLDLTVIVEGATVSNVDEIHPMLTGMIDRTDGQINICVNLPYKFMSGHVDDPAPVTVTTDGPIMLPVIDAPLPDPIEDE